MHTTECGQTAFIHNGDYSGDVDIVSGSGSTVTIPFADLLEFMSGFFRTAAIEGNSYPLNRREWSERLTATIEKWDSLATGFRTALIPEPVPEVPLDKLIEAARNGFSEAKRIDYYSGGWFIAVNHCPYGPAYPSQPNPLAEAWYRGFWFWHRVVRHFRTVEK